MKDHTHVPETAEIAVPGSGYDPRTKRHVYIYRLTCACGAQAHVKLPDHAKGDESPEWMAEHGTPVHLVAQGKG